MSRRAFFKNAGASAVGVGLLDPGIMQPADAAARGGEAAVFGPGTVPVALPCGSTASPPAAV
jgi:hypothetical protein